MTFFWPTGPSYTGAEQQQLPTVIMLNLLGFKRPGGSPTEPSPLRNHDMPYSHDGEKNAGVLNSPLPRVSRPSFGSLEPAVDLPT